MPPVTVDPAKIKTFESAIAFYRWLSIHHDEQDEVWIRIYKVGSDVKSITPKEAIDVCLCWGWIDAVRKRFDDRSYLQRYTRRRTRSIWSQINVNNVARLIAEGRMTEHGLEEVEAAKADGRWDRAEPIRARLSRAQHQDGSRAKEEDRGVRRHAQARRDHLPPGKEVVDPPTARSPEPVATSALTARGHGSSIRGHGGTLYPREVR